MFRMLEIRFSQKRIIRSLQFIWIIILCKASYCQTESYNLQKLQHKLDSITLMGIDSMAFPGAQIYISVDGKVVYNKAYGYHTYDEKIPVELDHVYDLASITKVTTGLPILMKLVGEGIIHLDDTFSELYEDIKKSNKKNLKLDEILTNQSGMEPYIVYWHNTISKKGGFKKNTFSPIYSKDFSIKISENLFLHKNYKREIIKSIKKSRLQEFPEYSYSGLFFLLLPDILEKYIQQDFESYLYEKLYVPLNLEKLTYLPRKRFALDKIVPTEKDNYLRHILVHGYVHDEAAAMLNGISCNAGLFGNAEDLGKLFEFYLKGGRIGDQEFLKEETIKQFAAYRFPENNNRRGLGFDKPLLVYNEEDAYIAKDASPNSFGHSGFTGTFVWADPDCKMVFVFLSNRVYPSRENRKLYTLGIRPKLHQAVYNYLDEIKNQ